MNQHVNSEVLYIVSDVKNSKTLFRRDFYSGSNPNLLQINCLNEQV